MLQAANTDISTHYSLKLTIVSVKSNIFFKNSAGKVN